MRSVGQSGIACLVGCCLFGWACSEEETRPGLAPDCTGDACVSARPPPVIGGVIGGSGGADGDGEGGSAGSGMPSSGVGTLSGTVRSIVNPDLTGNQPLSTALDVRAAGASASQVSTKTASGGTFRLEAVREDPALWVGVGPFDANPSGPYVDTLQLVDSAVAGAVQLVVMQRTALEQIPQSLVSTDLDPARAHALVTFLDAQGRALSGVAITFPAPDDVTIGYDTGAIYSDQTEQTSARGTVALLNLAAPAYPGGATHISAASPTHSFDLDLQVARGSITIASVQAAP
jgi:hypothetical protein